MKVEHVRIPPAILILVGLCLLGACGWFEREVRWPDRYLLPQGYVGWVEVEFKVAGAPPLPMEDGHYLLRIPSGGRLVTSSEKDYGTNLIGRDEYYYSETMQPITYESSGTEVGIWHWHSGDETILDEGNVTQRWYVRFFVGTKEQWEAAPDQLRIGPMAGRGDYED